MVMQDPPVHTEFRELVSRGFTPRQVAAVEPTVCQFVIDRIEKLRADGGGDIVTELFKPLPSMVVAHYLGVPEQDWAQFDGWTQAIVAANTAGGTITGAVDTVGDAVGSMMACFTGLIERRRTEPADDTIFHLVAADRILEAAERLYTQRDPASVGMNEIARAAGCSRATLYRCFHSREALRTAYVHRETYRLSAAIAQQIAGIEDPRERLGAGITAALRMVRDSPPLASWFAATHLPLGAEVAGRSEVIAALATAFRHSLDAADHDTVARRGRWVVRVIASLLMFAGRDDADERATIEEFVVPVVAPAAVRR
ncbi:hypothetical protein MSHI_04590 [Mycobacterium shinjukuense]|uniref:HTH tetR-type domain-containing protein n=1 Tax=Mycobacterium shinjukuense TaxID=398694 RepID=A0A7I7MLZ3_9MYCO|nr:hypothetical protein MSHI_04590 [Mycobacterium shinjukuense]